MTGSGISRRTLTGAAAIGVGVPLLAACGDDGGETVADPPASATPSSTPSPSRTAPSKAAPSPDWSSAAPPADALTATAEVPTGGGRVFPDEKVVVTQPSKGRFRCFTAVCTHQGCLVANVEGGTINCTCHGSRFSIADGSVANGPASSGLDEVPIAVQGGSISLA
jgi:nitrite reductase/ring-hydroxylating ferredoxin subunit